MLLLEPTVLVFEDTHWMDDASADLLRELTKGLEQRPWLIVATRRDQPSGFAAPEEAAPVIELEPLGAAQAAALAHAATEEPVPAPRDRGLDGAGGRQSALSHRVADRRSAGGRAEGATDSVESLMMAQIDRLSPHGPPRASQRRGDRDELREGPRGRGARAGRSRTGHLATVERVPDGGRRRASPLPPRPRPRRRLRGASTGGAARSTAGSARRSRRARRIARRTRRSCSHSTSSTPTTSTRRGITRAWRATTPSRSTRTVKRSSSTSGPRGGTSSAVDRAGRVTKLLESLGDVRVRLGDLTTAEVLTGSRSARSARVPSRRQA